MCFVAGLVEPIRIVSASGATQDSANQRIVLELSQATGLVFRETVEINSKTPLTLTKHSRPPHRGEILGIAIPTADRATSFVRNEKKVPVKLLPFCVCGHHEGSTHTEGARPRRPARTRVSSERRLRRRTRERHPARCRRVRSAWGRRRRRRVRRRRSCEVGGCFPKHRVTSRRVRTRWRAPPPRTCTSCSWTTTGCVAPSSRACSRSAATRVSPASYANTAATRARRR